MSSDNEETPKDLSPDNLVKRKYDTHEVAKRHLEKLFSRVDKPLQLPERKEKTLRPPREFFTNVPGTLIINELLKPGGSNISRF
jgi:hypothetical protein